MLYDDRDYLDYNDIDELYDSDDTHVFADEEEDDVNAWEYNYHNLTDELIED